MTDNNIPVSAETLENAINSLDNTFASLNLSGSNLSLDKLDEEMFSEHEIKIQAQWLFL